MSLPAPKVHFADIARELTEGITPGRYPIGSLLPTREVVRARGGKGARGQGGRNTCRTSSLGHDLTLRILDGRPTAS